MTIQEFSDVAAGVSDGLTGVALIIGGLWAAARFRREREAVARLQLEVMITVASTIGSDLLVQAIAIVENKGKVRHKFTNLVCTLTYIREAESLSLTTGDGTVEMPHRIERSWLPADWTYAFVEPSVRSQFSVLLAVPADTKLVHLEGHVDYGRGDGEFEACSCVLSIPPRLDVTA